MVNDVELNAYMGGWTAFENSMAGDFSDVMNPYNYDTQLFQFMACVRGWKECQSFFDTLDEESGV